MRKPLIVGIDPGTTSAYCALDTEGNVMALNSGKQLTINDIIFNLNQLGRIVAIGTDKRKVPFFVEKISIKLGSRIIYPEEDIPVKEKFRLSENIELKNNHELDALASAKYAFVKIEPLLNKIKRVLKEENKEALFEQIVPLVVIRGLNIKTSIALVEYKEELKPEKQVIIQEKTTIKPELLNEIVKSLRKENYWLRKQNLRFLKIIEKNKIRINDLFKKIKNFDENVKTQGILAFQEKRIKKLNRQLGEDELYEKNLIAELRNLEQIIIKDYAEYALVKKFANLDEEFSQKEKALELKKGDIIFINSFKGMNKKVLEVLRKKANIILHNTTLPDILKGENFIFIDNISFEYESKNFAILKRNKLQEKIKNNELLQKIIQDYRRGLW